MCLNYQLNLEAGTSFSHYWIQYIFAYLKTKARSINEISDHLSNNFVPGAVEPFVCVDMQMRIDVIFSLQKTKLTLIKQCTQGHC